MATITLNIPDAVIPRVIDALCARDDYEGRKTAFLAENPEGTFPNRPAFAKAVIVDFVKTVTRHYEAEGAAGAAHKTALEKADAGIVIT